MPEIPPRLQDLGKIHAKNKICDKKASSLHGAIAQRPMHLEILVARAKCIP